MKYILLKAFIAQLMEGQHDSQFLPPEQGAVRDLSRQVIELKEELMTHKDYLRNIVIGVVVAFIFTIGLVAVEVILFHTRS